MFDSLGSDISACKYNGRPITILLGQRYVSLNCDHCVFLLKSNLPKIRLSEMKTTKDSVTRSACEKQGGIKITDIIKTTKIFLSLLQVRLRT